MCAAPFFGVSARPGVGGGRAAGAFEMENDEGAGDGGEEAPDGGEGVPVHPIGDDRACEDDNADQVYQMQLSLFPFTNPDRGRNQK